MTKKEYAKISTDRLFPTSLTILCILGTRRGRCMSYRELAKMITGTVNNEGWIQKCIVQLHRAGLVTLERAKARTVRLCCVIELEKLPTSGRFVQLEQRPAQLRRREGK